MTVTSVPGRRTGPDLRQVREELHRRPELGLSTAHAQATVVEALRGLPLEVSTGTSCASVTAVLRGSGRRGGRAVLLRADMDAVPVTERTGLPYASTVPGAMHACGHDLHTAMLVGAAHALSARRELLDGDVVLMFQPGEEGWEGARAMIDEGVLDAAGRRVEAALALHVFSAGYRSGLFFGRPGPMMASSTAVDITVTGRGGHASAPHLARDPIAACAQMVTALYAACARGLDATDPVVLSIGTVAAGTRRNVIPQQARCEATLRAFSDEAAARALELFGTVLRGIAAAHDVEVDVVASPGRPVTVNDPAEHDLVRRVVTDHLGPGAFEVIAHPLTATEDFARVLARVPGVFLGLGATPPGADIASAPFNHSPEAVFDDSVMRHGVSVMTEWVRRRLQTSHIHDQEDPT